MPQYDIRDFNKDVIERSHSIPVLVDFWADWCGPCKILGPVLERLAAQADGTWALAKVDTEKHSEIAMQYRIQSIPHVKLFVDGAVINEFTGALPEHQLKRWLESALPGKHRKQIGDASDLLARGESDAARMLLDQVLAAEPGNIDALALLARIIVFTDPAGALARIQNIDEPRLSDSIEAVKTIARLLLVANREAELPEGDVRPLYHSAIQRLSSGDFDGAVSLFIDVIRRNRSYDEDGSRKACIAIFRLLGDDHPVTQQRRREFTSALY